MNPGKISLKGLLHFLTAISKRLKTPEEKILLASQAKKEVSEAIKTQSETITNALREISQTKSVELSNLREAIDIFRDIGYSEEEIKELVGPKIAKLLETAADIDTLKELAKEGQVLMVRVKELELPSKPY